MVRPAARLQSWSSSEDRTSHAERSGLVTILTAGRSQQPVEMTELRHYPLDSLEGLITRSWVELDSAITRNGSGSLCVT